MKEAKGDERHRRKQREQDVRVRHQHPPRGQELRRGDVERCGHRGHGRAELSSSEVVDQKQRQRAGAAALDGAFEWLINVPSADLPPPLWREVLRPLAEKRLADGMLSPSELAFCAMIVPATIAARLSATRADLQALASEPLESLPASLRLPTAFLLATFGLQASAQLGAPLFACGLFPVHEALKSATEPPEVWRLLQP